MAEVNTGPEAARMDVRLRTARYYHAAVCAYSFSELCILAGFSASGYISYWVVAVVAVSDVTFNTVIYCLQRSTWIGHFADPYFFLAQKLYRFCVALFLALVAPQIVILPLCMWIAVAIYGIAAPKRIYFYSALGAALVGTAIALFIVGPHFAMPTGSPAGQVLTWAALAGLLVRSAHLANFVENLRRRGAEKKNALRAALVRIEMLAQRDELTGLPNRRSVMEWLEEQIALCDRTGQALTIALIDLDHFKRVNDDFGHQIGDRVLQKFAEQGLATIRATDCFGRFGGEEFLVGLVNTPLQAAEEVLQRLRGRIAALDWSDIEPRVRLTVTIGAAGYRRKEPIAQLIKRADVALYRGKEGGRDRVVLEDRPFAVNLIGISGQLTA